MKSTFAGIGMWLVATAAATGLVLLAVSQVSDVATSQPAVQPSAIGVPVDSGIAPTTAPATTDDAPSSSAAASTVVATAPSTPSAPTTESYVLVGGVVAVTYSPTSVQVAWATPLPGYAVSTRQVSATRVEVEFTGIANRSRLDAWWESGARHTITNV